MACPPSNAVAVVVLSKIHSRIGVRIPNVTYAVVVAVPLVALLARGIGVALPWSGVLVDGVIGGGVRVADFCILSCN